MASRFLLDGQRRWPEEMVRRDGQKRWSEERCLDEYSCWVKRVVLRIQGACLLNGNQRGVSGNLLKRMSKSDTLEIQTFNSLLRPVEWSRFTKSYDHLADLKDPNGFCKWATKRRIDRILKLFAPLGNEVRSTEPSSRFFRRLRMVNGGFYTNPPTVNPSLMTIISLPITNSHRWSETGHDSKPLTIEWFPNFLTTMRLWRYQSGFTLVILVIISLIISGLESPPNGIEKLT